jgi:NCS1 nucleoside transporter family
MLVMLRAIWPSINALRAFYFCGIYIQLTLACSEFDARVLRNQYSRFPMLLSLLAHFTASHLVPCAHDVSTTNCPLLVECKSFLSRHFFVVKTVTMPIAAVAFLAWCIVKAHGIGPILHQPSTLHGSKLGWAMVVSTMSCISNMSTLITNAPDFSSRARTPSAALYPQLFAPPITSSIVSLVGIFVSSSSQAIYGEPIWSPVDLLGRFLDDHPSGATRFGVCDRDVRGDG